MEMEDDESKDPTYEAPPEPCRIPLTKTAETCLATGLSDQQGKLMYDSVCEVSKH